MGEMLQRALKRPLNASWDSLAQDALNRMRKAADRGTGCHLTAGMIASLNLTKIGQYWSEEDPRTAGQ